MKQEYKKLSENARNISGSLLKGIDRIGTDAFKTIFGLKSDGSVSKFKAGHRQDELKWNIDSLAEFLDAAGYKVVRKTEGTTPNGSTPVPNTIIVDAYLTVKRHCGKGSDKEKDYRRKLIALRLLQRGKKGETTVNVDML